MKKLFFVISLCLASQISHALEYFETLTEDGNSGEFRVNHEALVVGVLNSGTTTWRLQYKNSEGDWKNYSADTYSGNKAIIVDVGVGNSLTIRVNLSSSSTPDFDLEVH